MNKSIGVRILAFSVIVAFNAHGLDGPESQSQVLAALRDCGDCPEMIVLRVGKVFVGPAESEVGRLGNEGPQHEVNISKPFAISKFEVTRGQYAQFIRETGRVASNRCVVWTGGQSWCGG